MNVQGSLIIISAPSGTGKTSLVAALRQRLPLLRRSISHTTRSPRPGEENGVHYNFVNKQQFAEMLQTQKFLEHAEVFENLYGTSRDWVMQTLQQGLDVILEIDWQGAQQIRKQISDVISVFILPPSKDVLLQRLEARNQDHPDIIALRTKQAKIEVSHYNEYDYLIVNDVFEKTLEQLITIIAAARLRCSRQRQAQQELINELCQGS